MITCVRSWTLALFCLFSLAAWSQEKPESWNLRSCIEYARKHNIQIQKSRIALNESLENTEEAKAPPTPAFFSNSSAFPQSPFIL